MLTPKPILDLSNFAWYPLITPFDSSFLTLSRVGAGDNPISLESFALVILGLYAFILGLELGLFSLGETMAYQLTKSNSQF